MASRLNRVYRFKFYLNANHFIIINGVEGETHPHTWEFTVDILIDNDEFVQFTEYESAINEVLDKDQNQVMNDFPPFDHLVPTLENISEYFILEIRDLVEKRNGHLVKMESSETPTRSYIISFEEDEDFRRLSAAKRMEHIDETVDKIVDRLV